jgi:hypothetical protein
MTPKGEKKIKEQRNKGRIGFRVQMQFTMCPASIIQ